MKIEAGLIRQKQALGLLYSLLEEEFSALLENSPQQVSSIEFSIQELIRQLMDEKEAIKKILTENSFADLNEYKNSLEQGENRIISEEIEDIKVLEEQCSHQAMKNNRIASALAEQSAGMLSFFYDSVTPRQQNVYSAQGRWNDKPSKHTGLLKGRM
ncbi:flagellar export chaperone FlgN [Desulfonatronovibrio magnus]|uniref:flagellar export chaperone FlgN n=1 Tax=Desulfonatronovibrio magnus TaxID=698827 RepID=UPI000695BA9B|nr:flagellar export chaperone FlgN [Desulfonatronovibrio magnus]